MVEIGLVDLDILERYLRIRLPTNDPFIVDDDAGNNERFRVNA